MLTRIGRNTCDMLGWHILLTKSASFCNRCGSANRSVHRGSPLDWHIFRGGSIQTSRVTRCASDQDVKVDPSSPLHVYLLPSDPTQYSNALHGKANLNIKGQIIFLLYQSYCCHYHFRVPFLISTTRTWCHDTSRDLNKVGHFLLITCILYVPFSKVILKELVVGDRNSFWNKLK